MSVLGGLGRKRSPARLAFWIGNRVNFLPYRLMRAQQLRRRRRIQLAFAVGLGMLSALSVGEWQRSHTARTEGLSRMLAEELKQLEPALAERQALEQALQARAQRAALVSQLATVRDHAFHTLTALGEAPSTGIALTELRYSSGRTVVHGNTSGQHALTAWMAQLRQIAVFDSIEITDIQRRAPQVRQISTAAEDKEEREIDFSVHIQFDAGLPGVKK